MDNPYAPPTAVVADVIDPAAASIPAGRGIRLGATMLDGLIFSAMVYVPLMVMMLFGAAAGSTQGDDTAPTIFGAFFGIGAVGALAGLAVWSWLTIKYVKENGQSIAKKMLGIKVVRADGSAASLGRIFWLRNVVNTLLGVVPLYGLIDPLFIFGEPRQCVHDKIADTIVINA